MKPTAGIHQLNFTLRGVKGDCSTIANIAEPFGLTAADFKHGIKSHATIRKYETVLTHKDMIFIYLEGYGYNENTVHVVIKGSAFDFIAFNEASVNQFILDNNGHVTSLHLYQDVADQSLTFQHLLDSINNHRFRSRSTPHVYPGKSEGAPRSFYVGIKDRLVCYEKGLLHAEEKDFDYALEHLRLEAQLGRAKDHAHNIFLRWVEGEDIGALARGVIAGYITFLDPDDTAKNKSRRRADPFWSRYLHGANKITIVQPKREMNIEKQKDAMNQYILKKLNVIGPEATAMEFINALSTHLGDDIPEEIQTALLNHINSYTNLIH